MEIGDGPAGRVRAGAGDERMERAGEGRFCEARRKAERRDEMFEIGFADIAEMARARADHKDRLVLGSAGFVMRGRGAKPRESWLGDREKRPRITNSEKPVWRSEIIVRLPLVWVWR